MSEIKNAIKNAIKNFIREESSLHEDAGVILLTHSKEVRGLDVLIGEKFDVSCENIVNNVSDARRNIAITCISRMAAKQLTPNGVWNEKSLSDLQRAFDQGRAQDKDMRKLKSLKAVRLFALEQNKLVVADNEVYSYELAAMTGWVDAALSCDNEKLYGPAMLLLDSLKGFDGLPASVTKKAAESLAMVGHVIREGSEPERVAAMRVIASVVKSLAQAAAQGPLPSEASAWLKQLRTTEVVKAVAGCINRNILTGASSVGTAVSTLSILSKFKSFLKSFADEGVMRILVQEVLAMKRFDTSIFVLLRGVLTVKEVADAFTLRNGPDVCLKYMAKTTAEVVVVRDMISCFSVWLDNATVPTGADQFTLKLGLQRCLSLLTRSEVEDAKPIMALLVTWVAKSTNSQAAFQTAYAGPLDWAGLLGFLSQEDPIVVQRARLLLSWALHRESPGRHTLISSLDAISVDSLLRYSIRSLSNANYVKEALTCLADAAQKEVTDALAERGGEVSIIGALLRLVDDSASEENLQAAVTTIQVVAMYASTSFEFVVRSGGVGILVNSLVPAEGAQVSDIRQPHVLAAVHTILGLPSIEHLPGVGLPLVEKLVKVKNGLPISLQWEAFRAISIIAEWRPLCRANCKTVEGSMEMAVAMLEAKPDSSAPMHALKFFADIFRWAPADLQRHLGQLFIAASGPPVLVRYVKTEANYRNGALMTVLTIAMMDAWNIPAVHGNDCDTSYLNGNDLADVMSQLESNAETDVRTLCKDYPPYPRDTPANLQTLQACFRAAFGQLPPWPMQ